MATTQQRHTNLLYRDEVVDFLGMFVTRVGPTTGTVDEVYRDMMAVYKEAVAEGMRPKPTISGEDKYPALHPIALAKRLIAKRGLAQDKQELDALGEIIEKTYPRDGVTGFYAKQCMPVMVGLAHLQAQSKENPLPISLVEGDFSNMGGCNKSAIGREGTDKLIHKICNLLENEFKQYAKETGHKGDVTVVATQSEGSSHAETHSIRAGGDEVRMVVYGLEHAEVQKVLRERVHPRINLLAAEFGVHDVKHEKKGKFPGFGAAFAAIDLRTTPPQKVRENLNTGIEDQKRRDGLLRLGVVDEAGVERYLTQVYEPYLLDKKLPAEEIAKKVQEERVHAQEMSKETLATWKAMTAKDSPYPKEYHSVAVNPHQFFGVVKSQGAHTLKKRLDAIVLPKAETQVPFANVTVPDIGEAPESMRMRKALKALHFDKLAEADKALFKWDEGTRRYLLQRPEDMDPGPKRSRTLRLAIDLMRQFDAPDPVSRCKSPQLMVDDACGMLLRHQKKGGIKVVQFELGNVNGLNSLSYDFADAVLRETGKFIHDGLMKHNHGLGSSVMDHVYHEGGGKFKVMLPPDYPTPEVEKVAAYVNEQLHNRIRNQGIMDVAAVTYARPRSAVAGERISDLEAIRRAATNSLSVEKLSLLREQIDELAKKTGVAIQFTKDIPRPKDRSKSLTFKHYVAEISAADMMAGAQRADREAVAKKLDEVGERAEKSFQPGAGHTKTG